MNARIQNKWEHCVARFVGQASHGVHMREPNTRIETICKSQSCMVLSETEQAKVGQASHGVHMRDRLMLVRARSVHSYSSGPSPAQSLVGDRVAVFACFLTGWPVLVPRHVVAGRVSFSLWAQMALDNSRMMAENLERKKTLDVAKKKYKTKYDKAQYRASTVTLPVKCPGDPLPPAAHSPLPGVVFCNTRHVFSLQNARLHASGVHDSPHFACTEYSHAARAAQRVWCPVRH